MCRGWGLLLIVVVPGATACVEPALSCVVDDDCGAGARCVAGLCERPEAPSPSPLAIERIDGSGTALPVSAAAPIGGASSADHRVRDVLVVHGRGAGGGRGRDVAPGAGSRHELRGLRRADRGCVVSQRSVTLRSDVPGQTAGQADGVMAVARKSSSACTETRPFSTGEARLTCMAGPSSARARSRSIAHRWGPVCVQGPGEQAAIGVRYDEEDDAAGESFLVKLSPGRAEIVDQIAGMAQAVAVSRRGRVFVLDARGVVHVEGRKHRLSSPRALVSFGEGVALAAGDRVWILGSGDGVEPGPVVVARRLASSSSALLAATDDGRLVWTDGSRQREIDVPSGGQMSALAVDDEGRVVAASGRTLLVGDVTRVSAAATAPFEIHCVALHHGRPVFSSRAHGLFAFDPRENKLVPIKPSLRAHTLAVKDGVLVAASDLFVATCDEPFGEEGASFLTRDLAPFVRLADQRLPRFAPEDDPTAV